MVGLCKNLPIPDGMSTMVVIVQILVLFIYSFLSLNTASLLISGISSNLYIVTLKQKIKVNKSYQVGKLSQRINFGVIISVCDAFVVAKK